MTKASLVSNDKNNIDLVLSPIKTESVLSEADIYELVENSTYSNLYVANGNIKNAIAELKSVLKPLKEGHTGREIKYQILERRDAVFTIEIASDLMSATAEITTALGGNHLNAKEILDLAQAANVCKGFSKEQLVKLAERANKEPAGSSVKGDIAHGKLPIDGKNAYIKHLVKSAQDRVLQPQERNDGSVDMRDLGEIICVKIGDPLAKKVPYTDGIPGYTVTGDILSPVSGADIEITIGNGTILCEKNNSILLSTQIGLPRIIENGMEVDSIYHLKTVDISTGHVNFEGSVIIDGNVSEGMKVVATGDISVGGFVESATLDAGRDITIGNGIIGKKQDIDVIDSSKARMSVNIKAGGKVYAKYSQYADITCDSLKIEKQIMHNIIRVDKTLWVGSQDKANGKLIAGYVSAGESVRAGVIGATAGSFTIITFSDKMNDYLEKIEIIDLAIKTETSQSLELRAAAKKLKSLPKEKAKPELLTKVVTNYKYHIDKLASLTFEKESLDEVLQEYMNNVSVEANEKVYHGVQVIVGEFQEKTRREYGPSRFSYKERKVHITPLVSI